MSPRGCTCHMLAFDDPDVCAHCEQSDEERERAEAALADKADDEYDDDAAHGRTGDE